MSGRTPLLLRSLVAALFVAAPLADAAAQAASPSPPPSSREVIRAMSETLRAAERIRFRAEIEFDEVLDDGQRIQFAGATSVKLRKPNGLSVDYRDDVSAKKLWYDGSSLTLYDPFHDVYASAAAPPEVGEAVDRFELEYGVSFPLATLVLGNPYETVISRALRGTYLGLHDVSGTACHHVAFVGENVDFQLWVEQGERALPRKLVVIYKQEPGFPQYEAKLLDWDLDAKLSDADFRRQVPAEAVATSFLAIRAEGDEGEEGR